MINESLIRVLLVEDHPLYRMGLRMALSYSGSKCKVIAEAENVVKAKELIEQRGSEIDVILLDYYLPDGIGLDVVEVATKDAPQAKILLISAETKNPNIQKLLDAGINGFISKDVTSQELCLIITSVYHGHDYFDKNVISQSENGLHQSDQTDTLSQREIDVMVLCAKGMTAKQIAEQLNISPRTVEKHKDRIFSKLCFNSTVELVNYAIRNGLV